MTARDPIEAAANADVDLPYDLGRTSIDDLVDRALCGLGMGDRLAVTRNVAQAAIATYLRARADIAETGPIGEWPRMLRNLADEVERAGKEAGDE